MGHYYKFTAERVLHSQWDRVDWPCDNCYGNPSSENPNPNHNCVSESSGCCCCKLPFGRTLDFFDTDLIVDVQAKQDLLQLCRNEGNLLVYRLSGDQSDKKTVYTIADVPEVYTLFDDLSYDLARLDLKAYAENAVGQQMG